MYSDTDHLLLLVTETVSLPLHSCFPVLIPRREISATSLFVLESNLLNSVYQKNNKKTSLHGYLVTNLRKGCLLCHQVAVQAMTGAVHMMRGTW